MLQGDALSVLSCIEPCRVEGRHGQQQKEEVRGDEEGKKQGPKAFEQVLNIHIGQPSNDPLAGQQDQSAELRSSAGPPVPAVRPPYQPDHIHFLPFQVVRSPVGTSVSATSSWPSDTFPAPNFLSLHEGPVLSKEQHQQVISDRSDRSDLLPV